MTDCPHCYSICQHFVTKNANSYDAMIVCNFCGYNSILGVTSDIRITAAAIRVERAVEKLLVKLGDKS